MAKYQIAKTKIDKYVARRTVVASSRKEAEAKAKRVKWREDEFQLECSEGASGVLGLCKSK